MSRPPVRSNRLQSTPRRTRALMVDVDGVLVHGRPADGRRWDARLEADLGLSPELLRRSFFAPHWDDVVSGRASLAERLAPVLGRIAPHLGAATLIDYWFANDARLDRSLLADIARWRASGLEVHLASNQEHLRARHLWETMRLGDMFDVFHYSAALGAAKPSAAFFAAVKARTGLAAGELLLIDDGPDNVRAARAAGWHAVEWTGGATLDAVLAHR